jgi:2-(1,2-epoxy-1,2-dihydrophenyl)acetyl-CoA isomerase
MDYETLLVDRAGAVETITLNRPKQLNALNLTMKRELSGAIDAAIARDETRAVVLTGAGRAFCAGADLKDMSPTEGFEYRSYLKNLQDTWVMKIVQAPKPFVAAVNGPCVGGGLGIAMACDFMISSPDAYYLTPFVRGVGIPPDMGTTFFLPASIGLARARAMIMLGKRVSAAQAHDWGLVHDVVDDPATLLDSAIELAQELTAGAPLAIQSTKRMLYGAARGSLEESLDAESFELALSRLTRDHQEGVQAFSDGRRPEYTGR